MHLTIKGTLLTILLSAAIPASVNDDTSCTTSQLFSIPGAMGDPFAGLMLTSPSFTIPKLNRIPPIIEGMPQSSVGYLLDGCPIVFDHQSSGPATLSEQSIYPGSYGLSGISVPIPQRFPGPFFFDGYRSWFHGTSALRFSQDHSYVSPEYGFFTGPAMAIVSAPPDSLPLISARSDNRETSLDASVPIDY